MSIIKDGITILFQGDSVTDAGRSRTDDNELGFGYPMMVAAWLAARYPEKRLRVVNRGVGGNLSKDLVARWQEDCVDLKPDVVSILVGINDTWRRYDGNDITTSPDQFEANYRNILTRTREQTGALIIMLEPFVLHVPEDRAEWRVDLDPKIHVVRRLAQEFNAAFVPLDGIFASASAHRDPAFWCADGVHPTPAGHMLITQSWLKAIGEG